jgi:uncharacterized phage protein gp47/JayE
MNFPSFSDMFNTFSSKVKEIKPGVDPTVMGSWALAFGRGISAAAYSIVILAKEVLRQFNPLTSTGEFLELWSSYDNITRLDDSASSGIIWVYGTNSTVVPASTTWAGQENGLLYTNTASSVIAPQDTDTLPISIINLTRVGFVITADTSFPHGLTAGETAKISGAIETDYNGSYVVTPDGGNTYRFTYTIGATPTTPATGDTIQAVPVIAISSISWLAGVVTVVTVNANGFIDGQEISINDTLPVGYRGIYTMTRVNATTFTYPLVGDPGASTTEGNVQSVHAVVNVQSSDTGPETVVDILGPLDLQDVIVGVETVAYTPYGIQGGALAETDDVLRSRLLTSRFAQEGVFTNDQITLAALLINGNTRVYIQNPTASSTSDPDPVLPGQVRVYIIRDNDPLGPIPTGGILADTKRSILENGRLPAEMSSEDVFVAAPVQLDINVTLNNVTPDTSTMRTAIRLQLEAYFNDSDIFGSDLDNDTLRGVVSLTQDLATGDPTTAFITSFDWITVSETVASNELPILGTLTVNGIAVT